MTLSQILSNITTSANVSTYSSFNLVAIMVPLIFAAALLVLTSTRVFRFIIPLLGRSGLLIKRIIEGGIVYTAGYTLYTTANSLSGIVTLEDMIHIAKWGAAFLVLGIISAWTRSRIYENATGKKWPNLRDLLHDEKEEKPR